MALILELSKRILIVCDLSYVTCRIVCDLSYVTYRIVCDLSYVTYRIGYSGPGSTREEQCSSQTCRSNSVLKVVNGKMCHFLMICLGLGMYL